MQLPTPPESPRLQTTLAPEERLGLCIAGRYRLNSVLGVGAYGVVYAATDVLTGATFAVKALNKSGLDARQRQFQQREIELHQQASGHPSVCSVIQVFDLFDITYVVLEYCGEGDLFTNITERGQYVDNDALAKRAFLQILDAVHYCHSLGIYHRDLKPENILVSDHGMNVKVADFGLATRDHYSTDFGCGSTFYMSPECQQAATKPFDCYASAPNDVWSLGVVLVNLTCGRNPWKRASPEDSTFRAFLRDPNFLRTILPITSQLDCILRRIFDCDAQRRITIPELRSLILQCSSFTHRGQQSPSSLPTPPVEPVFYPPVVEHNSISARSSLDNFEYAVAEQPAAASAVAYHRQHAHVQRPRHPAHNGRRQHQKHAAQFTSPQTSGWYASFMPAFDLAQKHMSIEPFISSCRVF